MNPKGQFTRAIHAATLDFRFSPFEGCEVVYYLRWLL